jgi:thiamine-monophosphate kinase
MTESEPEDLRLSDVGEFGLIDRIREIADTGGSVVGIGDDAAVIDVGTDTYMLASVDMLVEDVHFLLDEIEPFELGRRSLAVNISDIAAMGGVPRFALTSVALRPEIAVSFLDDLYEGIRSEGKPFDIGLVGGNVARTAGPLTIDVTLLGEVPKDELVLRKGAQIGDTLAVTGFLGDRGGARLLRERLGDQTDAQFGDHQKHHAVPKPRVAAARSLAKGHLVHAMLDISDGLASDIRHLAQSSAVGAVVFEEKLPVSVTTRRIAKALDVAPAELALYAGEDYELLMALPPESVEKAKALLGRLPLRVIGEVLFQDQGVLIERAGGVREPLEVRGWTHF